MTLTPYTRRWLIYSVLVTALTSIIMGGAAIQYSNYAVRKSQQQWCKVVATLNEAYKKTPPQTPAGKQLAEEFSRLATQFKCEE